MALADYLKDETQSYVSIASKYGVSLQAVKKRAGREGWVSLRQKSIQKVNQRLPEITGETVAMIDARQAQMGKVLQYIGLKAIIDKGLTPENFAQAKESMKDGAKIEREAVDAGAEERKKKYLSNLFNKAQVEYTYKEPITQSPRPLLAADPVNKLPEQTPSNKPMVDPKLLKQIQEQLSEIELKADELKKKLEVEQAEEENSTSLSGWY